MLLTQALSKQTRHTESIGAPTPKPRELAFPNDPPEVKTRTAPHTMLGHRHTHHQTKAPIEILLSLPQIVAPRREFKSGVTRADWSPALAPSAVCMWRGARAGGRGGDSGDSKEGR